MSVPRSPSHERNSFGEFRVGSLGESGGPQPTPPGAGTQRSPSLNAGSRTARSPRSKTYAGNEGGSTGAATARQYGKQAIDLSQYDRNHKINRTRTNILQTSLMVPFNLQGGGWSRTGRFPSVRNQKGAFLTPDAFGTEEGQGSVKFSRTNRWKERDMAANSGAPGPGHYANPEEGGGLRGPVYAFSACPRETDPVRCSASDREWKEKLGPGTYDVVLTQHAVSDGLTLVAAGPNFVCSDDTAQP